MSDSANTQADAGVQRAADAIIARRQRIAASELSTYQTILLNFCRLLGIVAPNAKADQGYMFERPITFAHGYGSTGASRTNLNHQRHVEPTLVGLLAECALRPRGRHEPGAHYFPRTRVGREMSPAAMTLATKGRPNGDVKKLRRFYHRHYSLRALDPACGSGKFFHTALKHPKRLASSWQGVALKETPCSISSQFSYQPFHYKSLF